jgi:hypothetical protein
MDQSKGAMNASLSVNNEAELTQFATPLKNGFLVYFQHVVTKRFLMSCNIKFSKG